MSYVYDAGSTTPVLAGLAEIGGLRVNDGTYRPDSIGCLDGTPTVRMAVTPFGNADGGHSGQQFYDPFSFPINGWLWLPSDPDDVPAAVDQLRGAITARGSYTLTLNRRPWTARRQMTVKLDGPITFTPRHGNRRVPTLNFSVPLLADDPLQYNADTQQSVTITPGGSGVTTTITNNGNAYAPFSVRFTGPWTNPQLVMNSTAVADTQIYFGGGFAIAAGAYIDYNSNVATGGPTAIDNTSVNQWGNITGWFFNPGLPPGIPPGTSTWWLNTTPGAGGSCVVTFRDAWI